jgi:hypothetical protein
MTQLTCKDISFLIAYLGEAKTDELVMFVKEDKKKIFNELERLVGKSKIIASIKCGELVYTFNYSGEIIKGYKFGTLEALK